MNAITNQTGRPHWDAHGRLVQPGGIIGFDSGQPPAHDTHTGAGDDARPEIDPIPLAEAKPSKGLSK